MKENKKIELSSVYGCSFRSGMSLEEKIVALSKMGLSARYICEKLHCTKYFVHKVRMENGLSKDKRIADPERNRFPSKLLKEWEETTSQLRRCNNE